jgi:hypothetical protein
MFHELYALPCEGGGEGRDGEEERVSARC